MATKKKASTSKPLSKKVVKSIREQKTFAGKIGALARGQKDRFKEHMIGSVTGGATTVGGTALNLLGARGAKQWYEMFYGKNKGGDGDVDDLTEKMEKVATKQGRMLQSIRDVVKSHSAKLKSIDGNLGLIAEDVSDIKSLLMPKTLIAKGRKGTADEGKTQTAYYNPLAPSGNQMGQIRDGKLTPLKVGKNYEQSAIMKASFQSATLALKIAKKDQERGEMRKKNQWKDPKELSRRGDPIAILRQEMNDNFRKVFEMLEDLKKGVEEGGKGDGVLDTIADLALARSLFRRGGRGGGRGRGRTGARGKAGKPVSSKAMERYQRRFGKGAAEKRFGKPKARGGIGVGGLVGGGIAYAAVDSMRDKDLVSQDPEELKRQAAEAKASGDAEKLKQLNAQVKAQKKDVKIQAAATGAAVGGAAAGQALSNKLWKLFVNFVKRRAPKLAAKIGARLASAGVMATVPVVGWIGTAVTLGFTAWMAWDLYQLWKEFSALSEAEKETYTDEIQKMEADKDKPNAKPSAAVPPPNYAMARELAASDIRTGPSSRGGRRGGKAGAMSTTPAAPTGGGGKFGGAGASGSWGEGPTGSLQKKTEPTAKISGEDDIKRMIMAHEGVRYEPYKDSLGLWTVGVGHLIGDGKTLPPEWNRKFSEKEIWDLFEGDYAHHRKAAEKIPGFSKLNKLGQGALTDLTFNMGPAWIKKFPSVAKALSQSTPDVNTAANILEGSKWYKQVKSRGPKIVGMMRASLDKMDTPAMSKDTMVASITPAPSKAPAGSKSSVAPSKTTSAGVVEGESRQMQAANRPQSSAPVIVNAPTTNNTQVASTGPKPNAKKASAVSQDDSLIRMSGRDAQHPVLA